MSLGYGHPTELFDSTVSAVKMAPIADGGFPKPQQSLTFYTVKSKLPHSKTQFWVVTIVDAPIPAPLRVARASTVKLLFKYFVLLLQTPRL